MRASRAYNGIVISGSQEPNAETAFFGTRRSVTVTVWLVQRWATEIAQPPITMTGVGGGAGFFGFAAVVGFAGAVVLVVTVCCLRGRCPLVVATPGVRMRRRTGREGLPCTSIE